jgi:hypothetical protein
MGYINTTIIVHALKIKHTFKTLYELKIEISTILPNSDDFEIHLSKDYNKLFKDSTNIENIVKGSDDDDDYVGSTTIWVGIVYQWYLDSGYPCKHIMSIKEMAKLEEMYAPSTFTVEARTKSKWDKDYY